MNKDKEIHERGFWLDSSENYHAFDVLLCDSLVRFFQKEEATVIDVGCGPGRYTKSLKDNGLKCDGFDGNPNTPILSDGICKVLDFSKVVDLGVKYDWVLSLEVGEHIPEEYEDVFISNSCDLSKEGIVLSWAVKDQPGRGHVNCRNNPYIKAKLASKGFKSDENIEKIFRNESIFPYFKNTIMVFRREY